MKMIKMVCASCQQTIDLDVDHMMSFCPYCGKKLMFDADDMSRIMNRKMAEAPKPEEPKPETLSQIRPQETSDQQPQSHPLQQAQNRQSQPAKQAQNRPAQSRPAQTTQSRQAQPKQSKIEEKPLWKEYWEIAYNYFSGNGVKKDRTMALQYLIKAAELGCTAAYAYLSLIYLDSEGSMQDKDKALWCCEQYYMNCSSDQIGLAAYMLALFYDFGENGYGVKRNPVRKNRLLKEAAEHGINSYDDFLKNMDKLSNNYLRGDKTNS